MSRGIRCAYCGTTMFKRGSRHRHAETTDHIVPRSKIWVHGVPDQAWHDINVIAVCSECNREKSDSYPLDWLIVMPKYGVPTLRRRLVRLGCSLDAIEAALRARLLAEQAAKAYVAALPAPTEG